MVLGPSVYFLRNRLAGYRLRVARLALGERIETIFSSRAYAMGNVCGPTLAHPFGGDAQTIWLAAGRTTPDPVRAILNRLIEDSKRDSNLFTVSATRWQAENASTRSSANEIFNKNP